MAVSVVIYLLIGKESYHVVDDLEEVCEALFSSSGIQDFWNMASFFENN